jgi:hypothetical protein
MYKKYQFLIYNYSFPLTMEHNTEHLGSSIKTHPYTVIILTHTGYWLSTEECQITLKQGKPEHTAKRLSGMSET